MLILVTLLHMPSDFPLVQMAVLSMNLSDLALLSQMRLMERMPRKAAWQSCYYKFSTSSGLACASVRCRRIKCFEFDMTGNGMGA